MQNNQSPRSLIQPKTLDQSKGQLIALPATPSFSLAEASSILDIEVQADQLLNYINKLTSLADRACSTAISQNETTQLVEENRRSEMNDLRKKLDQQNEKLHEQQVAIVRLEQDSKSQIATLETQLRRREPHRYGEQELELLRRENSDLVKRLSEAELHATKQSQQGVHEPRTSLTEEVAELRLKLAGRDETIQARNSAIKSLEADFRAKISDLEQRLRDTQAELAKREEKLKDKDTLIQATAIKEAEMGNLIKRLSAECAALSAQLQEKPPALPSSDAKKTQITADNTIWRRVIGRLQEDPQ
jgi:chromosome segregation ATPase